MKYLVLIGDGMTDYPLDELDGKTPLEAAHTPHMDIIARRGITGFARTIPHDFPPGSDVANMSVLGYNPEEYYTGRAPLEAASMGIRLGIDDIAFRCNLVTLRAESENLIMDDFSAGHITSAEGRKIIRHLNDELGNDFLSFHPGISYRHLLVWKDGPDGLDLTPPHDISDRGISPFLPKGERADEMIKLMNNAQMLLSTFSVNREREENGLKPANSIWLWGAGRAPELPSFKEKYGLHGAVISAVDLVKGLGICAGLIVLEVPGATGYLDTNYSGKAECALQALEDVDFVYLHVESPDESSHEGNLEKKIRAIEDFDSLVVGKILEGMGAFSDYRILLLPDHATPLSLKTHTSDPVPYALFSSDGESDNNRCFNEKIIENGSKNFENGSELILYFVKG